MFIYSINLKETSEYELNKWFEETDSKKQKEIDAIKVIEKRNERIAADHLKRMAVAEYCGVSPDKINFALSETGKPYAVNMPVHFNISHSSGIVVCAVSDREIGIDIEKIKPFNPRTAQKFATLSELEYISSCEKGFFEIWTLKEAYFKCIGTGLGKDIKNVEFRIGQNGIICSEKGFEFSFHEIADSYICAVCQK